MSGRRKRAPGSRTVIFVPARELSGSILELAAPLLDPLVAVSAGEPTFERASATV